MQESRNIRVEARVVEMISNAQFRVEMPNGNRIVARLSGELRLSFIRILPGTKVMLELSPYDLSNGRIVSKLE